MKKNLCSLSPIPVVFASRAATVFLSFFALATTARAQSAAPILSYIWSIAGGERPYVATGSAGTTERGIAVNHSTAHVLLVSRASGLVAKVLDAGSGTELGDISVAGISGGTFALSTIRVAGDGVIYGANLSVAGSTGFRLYRWDTEDTNLVVTPVQVFGPESSAANTLTTALRWGDSFDLRGAGTNTQAAVSGSGNTNLAILTTADGTNFTATVFNLTSFGGSGAAAKGISFYTNNTLLYKNNGNGATRIVSFDLATTNLSLVATLTLDSDLTGIKVDLTNKVLCGVVTPNSATTANHHFKVWDLNANPPSTILDTNFPTPTIANGNVVGAADNDSTYFVGLDTQNGVRAFKVIGFATNNPPSIVTQPQSQSALQGGYVGFVAAANGTLPLKFQWRFNTNTILTGQTNQSLTVTNLQFSNSGDYSMLASNAYGTAITTNATLTVLPAVLSGAMTPLWSLTPGSRAYLTADNTQRGLAINSMSNHVLVVSRASTPSVQVLNAATGAQVTNLDMTGVGGQPGETFPVNLVGVADDGVIYVCNLANTGNGGGFTIYRWADDGGGTIASIAYGPDSPIGERIGDTFAVRGAGANTQIIAASRNGTRVVVFTTFDGFTFFPNIVDVSTEPAGFAGLGLAFGSGDTFWAKSSGFSLRQIAFDLNAATNGLLQIWPIATGSLFNLGVDPANDLFAGVARDTPDNLQLYDIIDPIGGPVLIDQDFFAADNANDNGTGAVAFDVNGGRVFALASNNGIIALKVVARLKHEVQDRKIVFSWTGPSVLQSSTNVLATYVDVGGATSPYTNAISGTTYFRLKR